MDPLLHLILWLLVAIILMGGATALLNAFKTPEPWRTVVLSILLLGLLVWFLRFAGVLALLVLAVQKFLGPVW